MKGLFIPEITAEMFKNGCLESIETLMAEGEIYDIEYPLEQEPKADGECISRQAVVNHICRSKDCYRENCKGNIYKRCPDTMWVYDLPFINPQEPKTEQRWKVRGNNEN